MGYNYRKWFSLYKLYFSIYMYDTKMDFMLDQIVQYHAYNSCN